MKFVCERCQTKYSIADDKVRGKILKVRCKTCSNVVTVREPSSVRPSVPSLAPVREAHERPPSGAGASAARSSAVTKAAPPVGRGSGAFTPAAGEPVLERTAVSSFPAGLFAPTPAPRAGGTPVVGSPTTEAGPWFLALDGHQHGPFTHLKLIDRLMVLPRDADIHVWNERMDGWKEPKDVPDIAREMARRRSALAPLPRPAPPVPPPPPAARPTVPVAAGPLGGPAPRLPRPSVRAAVLASAAPAAATAAMPDTDPATLFETPVPVPHAPPPGKPKNGTAHSSVSGRASAPAVQLPQNESDALNALNLGARVAPALDRSGAVPVPSSSAPRLMSIPSVTSWDGAAALPVASEGRQRSAKFIVGLIVLVMVICVVIVWSFVKRPATMAPPALKPSEGEGQFAALVDKVAQEKAAPPPVAPPQPPPPPEPQHGKAPAGHARPATRAGHPAARGGASGGGATAGAGPASGPAPDETVAARFRETNTRTVQLPSSSQSARGAPTQADITRVINNNKSGIKACYQRALLRDSSLTHGKIAVHLAVGISGRVKSVNVDGPTSFHALDPCIRELVQRWMFPPSGDGYETEFSYVFQGNE